MNHMKKLTYLLAALAVAAVVSGPVLASQAGGGYFDFGWIGNRSATPTLAPTKASEGLFVEGTLEVDGNARFDGTTTLGAVSLGAITGTSASLSTTLDTVGQATFGAAATKSTFTATGNLGTADVTATGALTVAGATALNGTVALGNAEADTITALAPMKLYSRTLAQLGGAALTGQVAGMVAYCSNCDTTGAVCLSTAAAVNSWVNTKDNTTPCGP